MHFFTKQENLFLLSLGVVLFFGAALQHVCSTHPQLKDIINFIDSDHVYHKVDINRAAQEDLEAVPYIGNYTARQIIEYRQAHGRFERLEDLKSVKGIRDKNFERFKKYLKVTRH